MTNKVYIIGPIISNDNQKAYDLAGVNAVSPDKFKSMLPKNNSAVEVYINSVGGSVFAGSEIYTMLKEYKGKVIVKVVGLAASIASVIAMGGDEIQISPTGQMMIHNVTTTAGGDYRTLQHTAEILKTANQSIANAYHFRTKKSLSELKTMMDKETWLNAQSAILHGFADKFMFQVDEEQIVPIKSQNALSGERIEVLNKIIKNNDTAAMKKIYEARINLLKLKNKYVA